MKKISLIIALVISVSLFAQDNEKGDKKSNEIMKEFTTKTESYNSFMTEFTYKMENKEAGIDESKDGELTVEGDKYNLKIAGQEVISDGETIWTYIEDAEEVQINSVEEGEDAITPNNLLTAYNKDYKSKFVKEDFVYGSSAYIIDLTPNEGKSFFKVRLTLDKDKLEILEISIFDKNGSTYSYVIGKFIPDVEIPEGLFSFDTNKYPDVDVVDMR
jgi:outer membrane lipoprotein-sorting protein